MTAAQITLADLEDRTGLDFGTLKDHDHLAAGGAPGTVEVPFGGGTRPVKPLRDLEEISI